MIRHHPLPAVLRDYARGALGEGLALAVACHLADCGACDAAVSAWESLGGALLRRSEPAALSDGALERAIARIGAAPASEERTLPRFLDELSLPAQLRRQTIGARHWITPSIWFASVGHPVASKARTYLLHANANAVIPNHAHRGIEFTAVLQGSFEDTGERFSAGDFVRSDERKVHSLAVTADGACLCLVGTEFPMRPVGVVARLIQALFGNAY